MSTSEVIISEFAMLLIQAGAGPQAVAGVASAASALSASRRTPGDGTGGVY
jgi:hypothetical protein